MIRRVVGRLSGAGAAGSGEGMPPAKEGGHGDHWGCVLRADDSEALLSFISDVVASARQPEMFQARGAGMAVNSGGEPLRARVLTVDSKLVSAYPEAVSGEEWPVVVRDVVPWANGIEGQLVGECYGAEIAFFDTRFYANRRRYRPGETYTFRMSAFAYAAGPAPDTEVDTDMGAKVSLKGAHAYMPANLGNPTADIDDFWFHSPLEAEPQDVELAGKRLRLLSVILAIPEHFEMRLPLYAAAHAMVGGWHAPVVGEDLEGFLWLQGYLAGGHQG